MDELYVSGSIFKKSVQFYREKILNFNEDGISLDWGLFDSRGCLAFLPWEDNLKQQLIKRQNKIIYDKADNIKFLIKQNNLQIFNQLIRETLNMIMKTKRYLTCALLEAFNQLLCKTDNKAQLLIRVTEFQKFIGQLESLDDLSQNDLDCLIYLFLNNRPFDKESLLEFKQKTFNIRYENLERLLKSTVKLGEMIAPERIGKIATYLTNMPTEASLVAPIYFALKSEEIADNWLNLNMEPDIDLEKIEKNARVLRIPNNLINIVRR